MTISGTRSAVVLTAAVAVLVTGCRAPAQDAVASGSSPVTIVVTDHTGLGPRPDDVAVAGVNSCIPVGNG